MSLVKRSSITPELPKEKSRKCSAYGCRLAGSTCHSTPPGNESKWYCRFHFGSKPDKFDAITASLHSNEWLIELMRMARDMNFVKTKDEVIGFITETVNRHGEKTLVPITGKESVGWWLSQADGFIARATSIAADKTTHVISRKELAAGEEVELA